MWMLLVRSFHTSRLLLMNFYKQVPKISLQEVTNCQAILLQHTEPPLLSTYVPGKHNPQPHRWASPRHLYVIPLGASAPSLRPLVGSTISWDATTVYSAWNKHSELAFPCQMQSRLSSLSDLDRKNGKSISCLQQIHRPISQCQRGKDGVSKVGDGIWSSIALSVSRSTSKKDPALLLGLLACFRHSRSGLAMNHVKSSCCMNCGHSAKFSPGNTKEGPKNTVKLCSFRCQKKGDALGTFWLSTESRDRA